VYWSSGTQVASLNWQKYDAGMQVNEAMFVGTMGWVEKPRGMRRGGIRGEGQGREKVVVELVGVSSCTFFLLRFPSCRAALNHVCWT